MSVPVMPALVVQTGDMADTCSGTSLTLLGMVKSIVAIGHDPKKIP
jgi:hypothetical protein